MQYQSSAVVRKEDILATNSVVKNTYILLSASLLASAGAAWLAMSQNIGFINPIFTLVGYMGLLFIASALRNSSYGILAVFALTSFMGYTLGPLLNLYVHNLANGSQLVMTAMAGTGAIFLVLSMYALTTRKDFSYMGGFLLSGVLIVLFASIANLFFAIPALDLTISAVFMLISSGYILYETSLIVNGGQTNYILATISLYVSIYNLFVTLLRVLSYFSNRK